jgi:predicted TIM-barrel fold metal-dependent hydrolase
MSIDCHTYIGHWPFRQLRGNTPRGLISYMERFGLERSVVGNINGVFYRNTQPANEELAAAIKPFPGKFIPFAVINPSYADWEHDLDVCHKQLGMKGVRVYPQYHDYKLTDPRFEKLLAAAHARNMTVAFSRWLEDPRQRSWLDIGEELPLDDLVPVVAHNPGTFLLLNAYLYPLKDEHLRIFREARIYFDTVYATTTIKAWSGYDISGLVEVLGSERFLFGSGYPFRDPISAVMRLEIANELNPRTKAAIWNDNARRLLKIEEQR